VGKQNKAARKLKISEQNCRKIADKKGRKGEAVGLSNIIQIETIERGVYPAESKKQILQTKRIESKRRQTKANRIFIAFISESIEKFTALKFYLERFA